MRQHLPAFICCSTPLAALAASLLARRRWSFVAGACLVAAVALWAAFGVKAAFVAATLGVVAWFWDERTRLRPIAVEAERQRRLALEEEEDEGDDEFEGSDEDEFAEHDGDARVGDGGDERADEATDENRAKEAGH